METNDFVFKGAMQRVVVGCSGQGFDMDRDNWSVEVRFGNLDQLYKVFTKQDMKVHFSDEKGCNEYTIIIDTSEMSGIVRGIYRADTPDVDCEGGIRKDVDVVEYFTVLKP